MNLFDGINALFRHEEIPDPPSDFMLHRFLASKQEYAPLCKDINLHVKNRKMTWEIWKGIVPKAARAPWLEYTAPKKEHADSGVVEQFAGRVGLQLSDALKVFELLILLGREKEIYSFFGIDDDA